MMIHKALKIRLRKKEESGYEYVISELTSNKSNFSLFQAEKIQSGELSNPLELRYTERFFDSLLREEVLDFKNVFIHVPNEVDYTDIINNLLIQSQMFIRNKIVKAHDTQSNLVGVFSKLNKETNPVMLKKITTDTVIQLSNVFDGSEYEYFLDKFKIDLGNIQISNWEKEDY